jgi:hypothetical protein
MSMKRFGYGLTDEDLQESPVGPYVRYDDYERLERLLASAVASILSKRASPAELREMAEAFQLIADSTENRT